MGFVLGSFGVYPRCPLRPFGGPGDGAKVWGVWSCASTPNRAMCFRTSRRVPVRRTTYNVLGLIENNMKHEVSGNPNLMRFVKTAGIGYSRNGKTQGSDKATKKRKEKRAIDEEVIQRAVVRRQKREQKHRPQKKRGSRGLWYSNKEKRSRGHRENWDPEGGGTATMKRREAEAVEKTGIQREAERRQ